MLCMLPLMLVRWKIDILALDLSRVLAEFTNLVLDNILLDLKQTLRI